LHQTHPTVKSRAPKRAHHGHSFLRLRKPQLAFGAITFTALMASIPALPASADMATAEVEVVNLQSLVTPTTVSDIPVIQRDDYVVTEFSIVQAPAPAGTGILSAFGGRASSCEGCSSFHSGTDFGLGAGTPVLAIADGVVTEVGPDGSLGTYVKLEHVIDGATITSTYAHMGAGSMPFGIGATVARGTQLGIVGMTGAATAPHLHFEIRLGGPFGTPVNPVPWLAQHVNA
jgi:murein DD-endopeptidase MepM/ murein hydrolase activator NlpD